MACISILILRSNNLWQDLTGPCGEAAFITGTIGAEHDVDQGQNYTLFE